MPLSSKIEVEPTPFELPNKKILLFNHRWNESSGIKKLLEYTENLPNDYLVWVTDENCDIKRDDFFVKKLRYSDYAFLLKRCYASLCFIDGYSTWNLSVQDSLIFDRPVLFLEHPTIRKVVGHGYNGGFRSVDELNKLLNNLPEVKSDIISEHDTIFEENLKRAMQDAWKDTKKPPKDAEAWVSAIEMGLTDKKTIASKVNDKVRLNSTAHFIRRHLLHNGVRDNTRKPYTEYYIEGNPNTIKHDLFS